MIWFYRKQVHGSKGARLARAKTATRSLIDLLARRAVEKKNVPGRIELAAVRRSKATEYDIDVDDVPAVEELYDSAIARVSEMDTSHEEDREGAINALKGALRS